MYRLGKDAFNWILIEVKTNQDQDSPNFGKEYETNIAYYSTLDQLAYGAIEKGLKVHGIDEFLNLKENLTQLFKEIAEKKN